MRRGCRLRSRQTRSFEAFSSFISVRIDVNLTMPRPAPYPPRVDSSRSSEPSSLRRSGLTILAQAPIQRAAINAQHSGSFDLMTAHLFEYSEYVASLEFRQRNVIECCFLDNIALGRGHALSGKSSGRRISPLPIVSACSTAFSSSLTLPGHEWVIRTLIASLVNLRAARRVAARTSAESGKRAVEYLLVGLLVGQPHGNNIQPVKQILPKLTPLCRFFEILVAG